jgi:hypothetical protein
MQAYWRSVRLYIGKCKFTKVLLLALILPLMRAHPDAVGS